jgi:hypothetical protein
MEKLNVINDFSTPNILFIKGVFIQDCIHIDDMFEQQLLDNLSTENTVIKYNQLPSIFTTLKDWVDKTNTVCWNCDLNFDTTPVFIPTIIEPTADGHVIGVYGCFHSFCCAQSYINTYYNRINDKVQKSAMLKFLYKIFKSAIIKEILQAPDKYKMKRYGGTLDNNEYKDLVTSIENEMKTLETPIS